MSERRETDEYDVRCPHCKKQFAGELLAGTAARYRGFKCPHCKLFVPYERAAEETEITAPPRFAPG